MTAASSDQKNKTKTAQKQGQYFPLTVFELVQLNPALLPFFASLTPTWTNMKQKRKQKKT